MDDFLSRYTAVICPNCNDYMEFWDEGIDSQGRRCDLYVCIECGHERSIYHTDPRARQPRYPWDPPDGFYED